MSKLLDEFYFHLFPIIGIIDLTVTKERMLKVEVMSLFKPKSKLTEIPIDQIVANPHQPRKVFSSDSLAELCDSIKQYGLIQPITVRKGTYSKYELIAGERRLRACTMAEMKTIPAIIIDVGNYESASIAMIENLQRENLNFFDEAEGYSNLISDFNITQEELAQKIGKTQATIANKIRILKLSPMVKKIIKNNNLTERHARALLKLPNEDMQTRALKKIIENNLNVTQTDEYIDFLLTPKRQPNNQKSMRIFKDIRIFSNTIKQAIDMMNKSGVKAYSEKTENDEYIEYIVKIPKQMGL